VKGLKVISTKLTPYLKTAVNEFEGADRIVDILEKERAEEKSKGEPSYPILMVLPEEIQIHGEPNAKSIDPLKLNKKLKLEGNKRLIEALEKIGKAARQYNAHILFAGPEKPSIKKIPSLDRQDLKKEPFSSMFILNGGGLAIVRRKMNHDMLASPASMKTLRIEGFNVLPLICREFLDKKVREDLTKWKKRIRKPDLVAVSALHETDEAKLGFKIEHPLEYVEGIEKINRLGLAGKESLFVISNKLGGEGGGMKFYHGNGNSAESETRSIGHHKYGVRVLEKKRR